MSLQANRPDIVSDLLSESSTARSQRRSANRIAAGISETKRGYPAPVRPLHLDVLMAEFLGLLLDPRTRPIGFTASPGASARRRLESYRNAGLLLRRSPTHIHVSDDWGAEARTGGCWAGSALRKGC